MKIIKIILGILIIGILAWQEIRIIDLNRAMEVRSLIDNIHTDAIKDLQNFKSYTGLI